jgi:hypothetical protein
MREIPCRFSRNSFYCVFIFYDVSLQEHPQNICRKHHKTSPKKTPTHLRFFSPFIVPLGTTHQLPKATSDERRRATTGAQGAGRIICGISHIYIQNGAPKKNPQKTRNKKTIPKKQPTDFPSFFFLGAPCVGCGPSVNMPPHVSTRSWLWGLPLRASAL